MSSKGKSKTNKRSYGPMFVDRLDAGRQLGEELRLRGYADEPSVVIAIPRGGVPVGYAVAQTLGSGLQIIIPRKLLDPDDPQTSIGAITPDGTMVLNLPVVERQHLTPHDIKALRRTFPPRLQKWMPTPRAMLFWPIGYGKKNTLEIRNGRPGLRQLKNTLKE